MAWNRRELVFLLVLPLAMFFPAVNCACMDITSSGLFFRCELTLQDFNFTSDGGSIISHWLRQTGYAGFPGWMNVMTASVADGIILHGTPAEEDVGEINLEVTVQNVNYQVGNRNVQLTVQPLPGQIVQYSEFYVTSHNLAELLSTGNYEALLTTLMEIYTALGRGLEPVILALIDPQERNIAVPEPPAKLGVILQISPGLNIETELPTAAPQAANSVQGNCSGSVMSPPLNFRVFSQHGFAIDWCRYTVQYQDTSLTTGASETPPPSGMATPTASETSLTLIVIVAVVGVVSLLLLCALTCAFFCGRRFSIILPKSRRSKNAVILKDTNSTILEASKAQVVLRSLSTLPPPEVGVARGVAERRPESTDTACLEYQDVQDDRDTGLESPPPSYHYDQQLFMTTRSSTPSN